MWSLQRTVDPTVDPVTLADAKTHLRVDGTDDDALITSAITAATSRIEEHIGRQLITATWKLTLDRFPGGDTIILPRPPIQSVTSVTFWRKDGTSSTVAATDYLVDTQAEPGRLVLHSGKSWPTDTLRAAASVEVVYIAGYGAAGADVPEPIRAAVKLVTGTLYEHRETVVVGTTATPLPQSVEWLLHPYRVWAF